MSVILKAKVSTNSALIYELQTELTDLSASVVDLRPLIEDLSAEVQILEAYAIDLSANLEDLDIVVTDLSATVLDISINVRTIQDDIINFAELHTENIFIANNTFTSTVQANLAPTVDTSVVNKLALENAIAAIPAPDLTNYARLDIANSFVAVQTFQDTINAESIIGKYYTDQFGVDTVYGIYSLAHYVNTGETGASGSIQDAITLVGTNQARIIHISSGSFNETLLIDGMENCGIDCAPVGGKTLCELTSPNTLTITNSHRVRMEGLDIKGDTFISGTLGKHQFRNMVFTGGLDIQGFGGTSPMTEWVTFTECEIDNYLSIQFFTGIVYFIRCNFQKCQWGPSPTYSAAQVICIECAGIDADVRDQTALGTTFTPLGLTTYYLSNVLTVSDIQNDIFLKVTTPSLDNSVTSKIYVDSEITSAVALKADLLSPTFTGSPSLPTASTGITQIVGDNSTKLATTAFVLANGGSGGGDAYLGNAQTFTANNDFTGGLTSSVAPTTNLEVANKLFVDGAITTATSDVAYKSTANVFSGQCDFTGDLSTTNNTPVGNNVITKQYLDTQTVLKADLLSPAFTGSPSLPTASTGITQIVGDNSTKLATTEFVLANSSGTAGVPIYFLLSHNLSYANVSAGNYFQFGYLNKQYPNTGTIVKNGNGDGYVIQVSGLYQLSYSLNILQTGASCLTGFTYFRNGVETVLAQSGISASQVEGYTILADLLVDDIVYVKYTGGNSGNVTAYGTNGDEEFGLKTFMQGLLIGETSTANVVLTDEINTFTANNDFTGGLTSSVTPTTNLEVANKVFVDSAVALKADTSAVALKADLASPVFSGAPSLPTASTAITQVVGDNTTKLATTAFVLANAGGAEFVAFRANSTTNATITISAGNGEVTGPLDNTSLGGAFDTHGLWDNSTHRFTADRTGYWEITWKFYSNWTNLAYTANFTLRRIRSGVTTDLLITGKAVMITTDCTGLFLLEDGDQLYITHGGNASLNYNYGQNASFFQGRFISA